MHIVVPLKDSPNLSISRFSFSPWFFLRIEPSVRSLSTSLETRKIASRRKHILGFSTDHLYLTCVMWRELQFSRLAQSYLILNSTSLMAHPHITRRQRQQQDHRLRQRFFSEEGPEQYLEQENLSRENKKEIHLLILLFAVIFRFNFIHYFQHTCARFFC